VLKQVAQIKLPGLPPIGTLLLSSSCLTGNAPLLGEIRQTGIRF
jgi:hypothetical protein